MQKIVKNEKIPTFHQWSLSLGNLCVRNKEQTEVIQCFFENYFPMFNVIEMF